MASKSNITTATRARSINLSSVPKSQTISAPSSKTASWMGTKTFPPSPVKLSSGSAPKIKLGGKSTQVIGINYQRPKMLTVQSVTTTPVRQIKSMMPKAVQQLPTQITRMATTLVNSPLDSIKKALPTPAMIKAARPIKSMMPTISKVLTPVRPNNTLGAGTKGPSLDIMPPIKATSSYSSSGGSGLSSPYYAFVRSPGTTGVTKQTFSSRAEQTAYVNQAVKNGNVIDGAN